MERQAERGRGTWGGTQGVSPSLVFFICKMGVLTPPPPPGSLLGGCQPHPASGMTSLAIAHLVHGSGDGHRAVPSYAL